LEIAVYRKIKKITGRRYERDFQGSWMDWRKLNPKITQTIQRMTIEATSATLADLGFTGAPNDTS
jgi:hypothetical protein